MTSNDSGAMTVKEVASFYNLSPATVRHHARKGTLPAMKIGGRWRFPRETIEGSLDVEGKAFRDHDESPPRAVDSEEEE